MDLSQIRSLNDIVDVFSCCIFTWSVLTTIAPTFILAGAIAAFIPRTSILRYLGAGANKIGAYSIAALSGMLLSLCSCNIVPLFVSIYRSGAGIGPASAFLYAGPAINIVSSILVFKLLGWQLGGARVLAVPAIAIVLGAIMSGLFKSHERDRQAAIMQAGVMAEDDQDLRRTGVLFILLLLAVICGSIRDPWWVGVGGLVLFGLLTAVYFSRRFSVDEFKEWMSETWGLIKLVIPWLVPAIILIGIAAKVLPVRVVLGLVGDDSLRSVLFADLFGALMYFPILAEVVFVRTFITMNMTMGPALAILLTGAGLSLPGGIILGRAVGWRIVIVYQLLVIVLTTAVAGVFSSEIGQYMCECMLPK